MTRSLHSSDAPLVGVVMGSDSDWRVMSDASQVLTDFGIAHEVEVVSAHRTPDKLIRYGREARARGLRVIIAGAGGAAHLPGMLASVTALPIIGVPVATVSIGGARNAGLLAVRMLASGTDPLAAQLRAELLNFAQELNDVATRKGANLRHKVSEVFADANVVTRGSR